MRVALLVCGVLLNVLAVAVRGAGPVQAPVEAPRQPVAFSHRVHAGTLQMPCAACHPNPDPGQVMTLPPASLCLQCHQTVKADSPEIVTLKSLTTENREVPWTRVYQIPSYVSFSHRTHLSAGATCTECHGAVAERAVLSREGDVTMAGCINCHVAKSASVDCGLCHQPYGE